MLDIEKYLQQGEQRRWRLQDENYGDNTGKLRGGNSGCVTGDGDILGHCHRLSLLDYLGVSAVEFDATRRRMFDAGHWNEEYLLENLSASDLRVDGYEILREEEAQIKWTNINPETGEPTEGSGRPDLLVVKPHEDYIPPMRLSSGEIIAAKNYTPIKGIEAKKISSAWRANKVHWVGDPSNDYVIQGSNYSYRLGRIPWVVLFSNYDSHDMYYAYVKKGAPKKVQPTRRYFELTWVGDQVYIDGMPSVITGEGIDKYYQLILEMESAGELGPRPSFASVLPGGPDQFNQCDNCPLAGACDKYEHNYQDWLAAVRHEVGAE